MPAGGCRRLEDPLVGFPRSFHRPFASNPVPGRRILAVRPGNIADGNRRPPLNEFALQWGSDFRSERGEAELAHRSGELGASELPAGAAEAPAAMGNLYRCLLVAAVALVAAFPAGLTAGAQPATGSAQSSTAPATSGPKSATPATSGAKPIARPVQVLGAPVKTYGTNSAPITMEVFTDYECPTCKRLFEETLRPMISDYVAAGKVYLVHHDFPLPMHKYGYEAARWLNASARVGQFQNVEAALYDHQESWAADGDIGKYVAGAMSPTEFKKVETQMRSCGFGAPAGVKSASFALGSQSGSGDACAVDSYIEADRALGNQIPVTGTPTYVISYKGHRLPAGSGVVTWPILKQFFDSLLSQ
jgi:protein-disulfide isomerase